MLMEVFTPNRSLYPTPADQATAAVNEAITMEQYLKDHHAGTPDSTTRSGLPPTTFDITGKKSVVPGS